MSSSEEESKLKEVSEILQESIPTECESPVVKKKNHIKSCLYKKKKFNSYIKTNIVCKTLCRITCEMFDFPDASMKRSNSFTVNEGKNNLIREEFNSLYLEEAFSGGMNDSAVSEGSELFFFPGYSNQTEFKNSKSYGSSEVKEESLKSVSSTASQWSDESPEAVLKGKRDYELKYIDPGENLRMSYLNKLRHTNVWSNEKPKSHNSLIIFDWDDTLLCSSYLTPNGVFREDMKLGEKDYQKLEMLDSIVFKILSYAIDHSSTYIITNAAPGWVEYSSARFYPQTKTILDKVTIVSARGQYEKKFPGDSKQWKVQAFLETCRTLNLNLVTNLICLGDSVIEMEAAHILASKFSKAYIKTVKFKECPKPEELIKQLTIVLDQFNTIFSTVKSLTVRVEKKKKK